jgi:hypothetical protein
MPSILDQRDGEDRRNGSDGPVPWQTRAMTFIERVGVPAALLGFLIWSIVGTQAKDASAAATTAALMRSELASHHAHTEKLHQNIERYMEVQNLLTRQLCANSAKTDDQRDKCFRP